jgi:hypothetical protein
MEYEMVLLCVTTKVGWWVGSATGWRIGDGQRRLRVASATLYFASPLG